jgi:hypothetical protein
LEKPLSTQSATVPGSLPEPPLIHARTDTILVPLGHAERTTTKSSPPPATPWWKNKKKCVCLGLLLLGIVTIAVVVGVVGLGSFLGVRNGMKAWIRKGQFDWHPCV